VIGPADPAVFVREFLNKFLEFRVLNGLISTRKYHNVLARLRESEVLSVGQKLFDESPAPVPVEGFGRFRLVYLREPDGSEFPFLQILTRSSSPGKRALSCFVGHRFLEDIERALRFNLIHLFEPYKISLRWSGYDLTARDVFQDIVSRIKEADLCFFDNLGTLNKPNVYIEIGMAHILGKPMLVSEYSGPGSRGRRRIPDTGSVPSDLQGLLRIQYQSYEDLCKQLYFGLPIFLERHGLRG
jgi:hypothetical protein